MSFYQAHLLLCAGYSELFVSGLVVPPESDASDSEEEESVPELPMEQSPAATTDDVDFDAKERDLIISQTLLALEGKQNILPILEICSFRGTKRRRSRDHSPKRSLTRLFRLSGSSLGDFQFRPVQVK